MIVMMGICSMCDDGKEKRLAKRRPPLCGYHYASEQRKKSAEKNKDKPKKVYTIKKVPLSYKREPTGELELMKSMWSNMTEHKSFINGEPINVFNVGNFAHVLPKAQNRYPKFKLYEDNIKLLTFEQHFLWDKSSREDLRKLPEWDKMFKLEAELIEEYKSF